MKRNKKIKNRVSLYEMIGREITPEALEEVQVQKGSKKAHQDYQSRQLSERRNNSLVIQVFHSEEALQLSRDKEGLKSMKIKTSVQNALNQVKEELIMYDTFKYQDGSPKKRKGHIHRLSTKQQMSEMTYQDVLNYDQEVQQRMKGITPIRIRQNNLQVTYDSQRSLLKGIYYCKKNESQVHTGSVNVLVQTQMKRVGLLQHQVELLKKSQ